MQRRRQIGDLARGLPAIVLSLCVASLSAAGYLQQRSSGVEYWRRGEDAQTREDYRAAEVYLQKALKAAGADSRRVALTLAQNYEESGDLERAAAIMRSLAPMDETGFAEAHLFMAYRMARQRAAGAEINLDDWKWHIDHARNRGDGTVPRVQAMYYAAIGDAEASLAATIEAGKQNPEMLLQAVKLRAERGELDAAARDLERAQQALKSRYVREPTNPQYVVTYAQSLLLGERFAEAFQVLREAIAREPLPVYSRTLANTNVLLARLLIARTPGSVEPDMARVTSLLLEGLTVDPQNGRVMNAISALAAAELGDRQAFREEILRKITQGTANAQTFFVMGILEWRDEHLDEAIAYTRQALALAPGMANAKNNLAAFLILKEPPRLDRALELINSAIDSGQENPQFYETRAEVFTAREEYESAITDYLHVLSKVRDKTAVQQQLADLYELSGNAELARRMRAAAETTPQDPQATE